MNYVTDSNHSLSAQASNGAQGGAYPAPARRRGRKSIHIAPPADELRRSLEQHRRCDVIRRYGINHKTLLRWVRERGIEFPRLSNQRPRGITPRYVRIAFSAVTGKRVKARLYQIWDSMHKRCYYPKQNRYERYGGRGIEVCAEWHEYDAFRAWAISHGYAKGLTLDRVDSDGHYAPANCRWIAVSQQQWNTSRTIFLTHNGVSRPLAQWALLLGFEPGAFRTRRREGWTDEQIILTPRGAPRIGYVPQKRGRKPKGTSPSAGESLK